MVIRLKLPNHIQDMIQYRDLQIEHIKKAIRDPDVKESTFADRTLVRKRIDGKRVMEVVYYREGFKGVHDYVIITAYYLTND